MAKKKKKNSVASGAEATSFEDALQQLESIVRELEDGKVGLADALGRYEDGVKLLKSCYQLLEKAERRIELLSGVDADGNPVTVDFESGEFENGESDTLDDKARSRGRRRTAQSKGKRPASKQDKGQGLF